MNANLQAYFQIQRQRHFESGGLFWFGLFWIFSISHSSGLGFDLAHAIELLAPVAIGHALAGSTWELLHCPHATLLPGGRWRFLVWHGITVATVAVVWSGALWWMGDEPMLPIFFVALAGLALALPLEPGWRWFGSRMLCLTLLGSLAAVGFSATALHAGIVAAPWLASAVGAGIAAGCFALAGSPARLRARTAVRFVSRTSQNGDAILTKRWHEEMKALNPRHGRSWTHGPVGDSTLGWLRAMLHARYGFEPGGWPLIVLVFSLCLVGLGLMCGGVTALEAIDPLASRVYFALCEPQRLAHGFAMTWNVSWLFLIATTFLAYPKSNLYLPVARAQRTRVAHLFALLSVTMLLAGIVVTAGAFAWVASRMAGLAFNPSRLPDLVIAALATLPVLPFVQYSELPDVGTVTRHKSMVVGACGLILGAALGFLACFYREDVFSPAGLTVYLTLVVVGQFVFHDALRRFYRRCDLIQRGLAD